MDQEQKDNPKFSIITPTYNRARELNDAFKSVLGQSFEDFEWIIIDDGSTDNTKETVKHFDDPRIIFDFLPENRGVNAARNKGLDLAKGEYLVFLDSDDELLPEALETFQNIWRGNKDGGIGGLFTRCLERNTKNKVGFVEKPDMVLDYKDMICGRKMIGEVHPCWKKEAIGKERFLESVVGCEAIFWWRLAKKWKAKFVDVPTRIYNKGDGLNSAESMIRNAGRMTAGYEILIKENKAALIEYCPEVFVRYSQALAMRYIMSGEPGRAREIMRSALKIFPFSLGSLAVYSLSFFGKNAAAAVFRIKNIF